MIKRTLSAAFAALILYAALSAGIVNFSRTSQTRLRAEVFGAAVIFDLDRISDAIGKVTDGLDPWMEALPSFVCEIAENITSALIGFIDRHIPESAAPSCSLC